MNITNELIKINKRLGAGGVLDAFEKAINELYHHARSTDDEDLESLAEQLKEATMDIMVEDDGEAEELDENNINLAVRKIVNGYFSLPAHKLKTETFENYAKRILKTEYADSTADWKEIMDKAKEIAERY